MKFQEMNDEKFEKGIWSKTNAGGKRKGKEVKKANRSVEGKEEGGGKGGRGKVKEN